MVDGVSGVEIARYDLSGGGSHTGLVMGMVIRIDGVWRFEPVGEAVRARHPVEAVARVREMPA